MVFTILTLIVALVVLAVTYIKHQYQYWARRNVVQLEPKFPFGNRPPKGVHGVLFLTQCYNTFKKQGLKYGGIYAFTNPVLVLTDIDLIKRVMSTDFQHFQIRGFTPSNKDTSIQAHLLRLSGSRWKTLRAKLTPTFTSGKLKAMFGTLTKCLEPMQNRLAKLQGTAVDIKEVVACYTTDVIGSCAFGLDFNSFDDEEESPFRTNGKRALTASGFERFKFILKSQYPTIGRLFKVNSVNKGVERFFTNVVHETVEMREEKKMTRNDFLQLLINMKKEGELQMHEIVAQSFIFFLAGFETSSTATTFTMYLLAKHLDIQDKVRREIQETIAKHNGEMTYDAVQDMKYLDQVVNESLRLYPPAGMVPRKCNEQYKVPNDNLVIEKDTLIHIPIYAIHHDPEYYPDPERFDPERFSEENKNSRPHYTHLPFGEGPRICIGLRFGLMQTKVALVELLRHHKFTVNAKTQEPLDFETGSAILTTKGDVWLNVENI